MPTLKPREFHGLVELARPFRLRKRNVCISVLFTKMLKQNFSKRINIQNPKSENLMTCFYLHSIMSYSIAFS